MSVNNFKNETLYQKKEKTKKSPSPPPPPPTKKAVSSAGLKVDTKLVIIDNDEALNKFSEREVDLITESTLIFKLLPS